MLALTLPLNGKNSSEIPLANSTIYFILCLISFRLEKYSDRILSWILRYSRVFETRWRTLYDALLK